MMDEKNTIRQQIEQYFTEELTVKERLVLLKQVESDEELKAEFARYQNTQALLSLSDAVVDKAGSKRGYQTFQSQIKRRKTFSLLGRAVGYAAAIALIVIGVHLYHVRYYDTELEEIADTSLFVPAGQRVSVTLQDGTVVWLNAQTRLTYPSVFRGDERRVSVEGEAYFVVVHDKEKPFIVSAGDVDMKVLGTTFNVYNYKQEAYSRISLIEGSLEVYKPESSEKSVILRSNEELTIRGSQMSVVSMKDANYFLWINGIYSFENERLEVILKKLELYYDINIIVNDTEMLEWKYTVKFRQRDGIDEILRLMQKVHPFRMKKDEDNNEIVIDNNK